MNGFGGQPSVCLDVTAGERRMPGIACRADEEALTGRKIKPERVRKQ
jgi:hypothetical protein